MINTYYRWIVDKTAITVGLIGGGQMAEALIVGMLQAELFKNTRIIVADPAVDRVHYLRTTYGIGAVETPEELCQAAQILILAVKPQVYRQVLAGYAPCFTSEHMLISIMAGVTLAALEGSLPENSKVIRVMPNTPCLVQAGASAFSGNDQVTADEKQVCQDIFSAVGCCLELPEYQLDAVTGLSGSGPGYIFSLIDGFIDGGILAGLPRPVAQQLVLHTFYGAAKLAIESGKPPAVLKEQVTSPGGTTIRGIQVLEQYGMRAACMDTVQAAAEKSKELGA